MKVLITGFTKVGVPTISQSLKLENLGLEWQIVSYEIKSEENMPEKIDVGNFTPELVILVTDSTPKNVSSSYGIVRLLRKQFPSAYKIAIANWQDLPERLKPEHVEELLGLTTYGRQDSSNS